MNILINFQNACCHLHIFLIFYSLATKLILKLIITKKSLLSLTTWQYQQQFPSFSSFLAVVIQRQTDRGREGTNRQFRCVLMVVGVGDQYPYISVHVRSSVSPLAGRLEMARLAILRQ